MADDDHWPAIDLGKTANQGLIVGEQTISMELIEVGEDMLEVVQRIGTQRMPGDLSYPPISAR